ncbi:MAG: hypothetical protein CVT67_01825 [Actinobacteria bacterium HGW-Actinobacteria-7]|jgi:acetyltransferase EpsM|nr:MAG: hypothetical protein CVT67_01825 [Actinobacteria bacterium HGW-Actinobacteria-7]
MRVLVIGAGGFSKEVVDLLRALQHDAVGFYDERVPEGLHGLYGIPIVHDPSTVRCDAAVIAVGDTGLRMRFFQEFSGVVTLPSFVHPSACVSTWARLGSGTLVMQNAVISAGASVGDNCLINVGVYVAHDVVVGPHSHLAASVQLGGLSSVGTGALCGTATVVLPSTRVGDWAVCGSGAVVTRDVGDSTTVTGVPARPSS